MTFQEERQPVELRFLDIVDIVLSAWRLVALVVAVFIGLAVVAAMFLPRMYKSEIEITPMRGASYANFLILNAAGGFAYTPEALLREFSTYLLDGDRLSEIEAAVGATDVDTKFELKFANPNPQGDQPERVVVTMTAWYDEPEALFNFVSQALVRANRELTSGLRFETEQRIAALKEALADKIAQTSLLLDGRKGKLEAQRADAIQALDNQAKIARSLGLEKPMELSAQALNVDMAPNAGPNALPLTSSPPALISNSRPGYMEGYLALERQKELLEQPSQNGIFGGDLRDLEETVFVTRNDTQAKRIEDALANTPLVGNGDIKLAEFSLVQAKPRQTFPRPVLFVAAGLVLGLLIGAGLAVYRAVPR